MGYDRHAAPVSLTVPALPLPRETFAFPRFPPGKQNEHSVSRLVILVPVVKTPLQGFGPQSVTLFLLSET